MIILLITLVATSCSYKTISISDHAPLLLSSEFSRVEHNRRHWRLDPLLLKDENFVSHIALHIKTFFEINKTPEVSNKTIWEAMKAYLRGEIISYVASKQIQFEITNNIKQIDEQNIEQTDEFAFPRDVQRTVKTSDRIKSSCVSPS